MLIPYLAFLENTFEQIPMLPAATVRFSVKATDGIDTVNVTGEDRVVYVNRYDYLSTDDIQLRLIMLCTITILILSIQPPDPL